MLPKWSTPTEALISSGTLKVSSKITWTKVFPLSFAVLRATSGSLGIKRKLSAPTNPLDNIGQSGNQTDQGERNLRGGQVGEEISGSGRNRGVEHPDQGL